MITPSPSPSDYWHNTDASLPTIGVLAILFVILLAVSGALASWKENR